MNYWASADSTFFFFTLSYNLFLVENTPHKMQWATPGFSLLPVLLPYVYVVLSTLTCLMHCGEVVIIVYSLCARKQVRGFNGFLQVT